MAEVAVAVRVSRQVSELIERISIEEKVDKSTVIRLSLIHISEPTRPY